MSKPFPIVKIVFLVCVPQVVQPVSALPVTAKNQSFVSSSNASDVSARIKEGQVALQSGNIALAEKAFLEANRLNPKSFEALLGLAMIAQTQGRASQAQEWMNSAVNAAPGNPKVVQAQARLMLDLGRRDLVEEIYRKAIKAYPGVSPLRLDLANLYLEELAKPAEAIPLLRELLRQSSDDAATHLALGLAYSATGKLAEAAAAFEQSVRWDPNNPLAYHALGHAFLRLGKAEQALAAFNKALALRSDFLGAMLGRGDAFAALGRSEEALAVYARAAELAPGNAMAHAKRAQFLERLKRLEDAEAAYRDALKVDPTNPLLLNNLAALLAARETKLDEALGLASRAVAANPKRASHHDTLGSVYFALGNRPAARKSFEQAISLDPVNPLFKRHLAQVLSVAAAPVGIDARQALAKSPVLVQAEEKNPASSAKVYTEAQVSQPAAGNEIGNLEKQIAPQLEGWRQAWQSKDAGRYLSYYGNAFKPADKRSRAAWEADRRAKLDKPGEIIVEIANLNWSVKGDVVSVAFDQRYQSSNFRDAAKKQIEWIREGKGWRIAREVSR